MSDKNKNDFDFITNLFGSKKGKSQKKPEIPFDENYFDIVVEGGQKHSELINLKGVSKFGGEDVKLKCRWFLKSNQNDFIPFETQQQYQPNIEDAGHMQDYKKQNNKKRVMIQIEPIIEGREYEGMPKNLQIGPIIVDETVQAKIDEFLESEKFECDILISKIIKIDQIVETNLPINIRMTLNLYELNLTAMKEKETLFEIKRNLSSDFPNCQCIRQEPDQFTLNLDEKNQFNLKANDNIQRDIITTLIKAFYAQGLIQANNSETPNDSESNSKRGSFMIGEQSIEKDQIVEQISEFQQEEQIEHNSPKNEKQQIQIEENQIQSETQQETQKIYEEEQKSPSTKKFLERKISIQEDKNSEELKINDFKEISSPQRKLTMDESTILEKSTSKIEEQQKKDKKKNMDYLILFNENTKLKQEKIQIQNQLQQEQDMNKRQQKTIQNLQEDLQTCTKNFYTLESKNQEFSFQLEQLQELKIFLVQDNNLYKAETFKLKEEISNFQHELKEIQKRRRQTTNEENQLLKDQVAQLNLQLKEKELTNEAQKEEISQLQSKMEYLQQDIEHVQNELQHEKKKSESLAIEKGFKLLSSLDQSAYKMGSGNSLSDLNKYGSSTHSLDQDDKSQEIIRLRQQISNLESTIRSLKFAYDQDVRHFSTHKILKTKTKIKSTDLKFLQNLANQLSEVITDKDTALENQKQINKDLMTRIQLLQEELAIQYKYKK